MNEQSECNLDNGNEREVDILSATTLRQCGEIVFNVFKRFRNNEFVDVNSVDSSSISSCTIGDTFLDVLIDKQFDRLYDMMSHDLEKADCNFWTRSKLNLYNDLKDFMLHGDLHKINRYVFGNGSCHCWEPHSMNALSKVRTWCNRIDDKTKVPNSLIRTYKMAANDPDMEPYDLSMVAHAVFNFLLGYDSSVDFEILSTFHTAEVLHKPKTFQHVYNSALRHSRMFLDANALEEDAESFETLAKNQNIIAVFKWIFDLLDKKPDAMEKFISNPFVMDAKNPCIMYDVNGRKMTTSYIIQLRIFYRWLSKELYIIFSGKYQRRLSLLDKHIKELLFLCSLNKTAWLKLLNDIFVYLLRHFTKILSEHKCPEPILETFRTTWEDENFRNLIKLYTRYHISSIELVENIESNSNYSRSSNELTDYSEKSD